MPKNPLNIEDATNTITNAWTTLAPAASFGGMTLTQYKARVQPSFDARTALAGIEAQRTATLDTRDNADVITSNTNQLVVNGVKGDPNYGNDSEIYDAMGYVRKSKMKSGLTKKNKIPVTSKTT